MKALPSKGKKRSGRNEQIRRALLAKVHIAKAELGYDDDLYRMILRNEYGVESSAELSNAELVSLVARFQSKGWNPKTADRRPPTADGQRTTDNGQQVEALKARVGQELLDADFDEKRLRGLVLKICGVHELSWCKDVEKLKRLLAVIRKIRQQEGGAENG